MTSTRSRALRLTTLAGTVLLGGLLGGTWAALLPHPLALVPTVLTVVGCVALYRYLTREQHDEEDR